VKQRQAAHLAVLATRICAGAGLFNGVPCNGGANIVTATVRVTFWGAIAMAVTAGIGLLIGKAV